MWNKNDTSELIYKTEIDPQTEKEFMVPRGEGEREEPLLGDEEG